MATETLNDRSRKMMRETLDAVASKGLPAEGKQAGTRHGKTEIVAISRTDGTYTLFHEWYTPERYDSDDMSMGGFALPHRPGSERQHVEVEGATIEELREALDG